MPQGAVNEPGSYSPLSIASGPGTYTTPVKSRSTNYSTTTTPNYSSPNIPGLTNLVGTDVQTGEATLTGLGGNQNMTNPSSIYSPYYAGLASGGSTTNLTSGTISGVGDTTGALSTLTPTLLRTAKASLLGMPSISESAAPIYASANNPMPIQSTEESAPVVSLAAGGTPNATYESNQTGFPRMSPTFVKSHSTTLLGTPHNMATGDLANHLIGAFNEGGHVPEFYSEGGLHHRFVNGAGDGTSDSVPAMLANGEFVIPADVVSSLGNGSNDSGAKVLDEFLSVIRSHKQKHDSKHLPPDSKGPLAYLLTAKQKVRK